MSLSKDQIQRYSRQLILPEVGPRGQQRLAESSVLVIGAGGLGCPVALYLAAAGVGQLGILDDQAVELSNLHRQILHTAADVGRPKADSASAQLAARNPEVRVIARQERVTADNARELVREYDVVVDGSDNVPTRYLVNDACVLERRPLVHGGVIEYEGQVFVVRPGESACLRCVFPEPPEPGQAARCEDAGVLGSAAGVIGCLMAHETLKLLLALGEPLTDRLLVFQGAAGRFRDVPVQRDPACSVCGESPSIRDLVARVAPVCVSAHEEDAWPRSK